MPINTDNGGSGLVGKGNGSGTRKVTFIKQTFVASLGRNSAVGETQYVAEGDARFLIAYRYAKKCDEVAVVEEEVEPAAETVETEVETEVDAESEPAIEPAVETVDDDSEDEVHRFSRRRRRRS